MTPARLSSRAAVLKELAQDLQHMATALRQLIEEEHAMVRPRHLARRAEVPAADQAHVGDGEVGGRAR